MNHAEFARLWRERAFQVTEEQGYQEHFASVARLVGGYAPGDQGAPQGLTYQAPVKKVGTLTHGKADVFQPGHFIWEAKRAEKNADRRAKVLGNALQQATLYARDLGNPPLIVTTDFLEIHVHTNFTGTVSKSFHLTLDDVEQNARILSPQRRVTGHELPALDVLHAVFHDPSALDPKVVRERITTEATAQIGVVARRMMQRGHTKERVAHFLMRLVFAMFAEDVGLLERELVAGVLKRAKTYPGKSEGYFQELFAAMSTGGEFWGKDIRYFNGGLFDEGASLPLTSEDASILVQAADLDWSEVEPSIFGGLFESSLEEDLRSKRGAHFTAVTEVERIVDPVIVQSLNQEWEQVRNEAHQVLEVAEAQAETAEKSKRSRIAQELRLKGRWDATSLIEKFHIRLGKIRVLDPACGSGNFLYFSMKRLLDLEDEVRLSAQSLGAGAFDLPPRIHPRQFLGIEIEAFAAELASVTLWIGFFQWNRAHGGQWSTPVLEHLHNIEHRDALLNADGTEASWPAAEFIVGNPPFLGEKKHRSTLGDDYTLALRKAYRERVPPSADLVTYWVEKTRTNIEQGNTQRAGLVTTNSIRQAKSSPVLERVLQTGAIFDAWPDLPWTQDGAAVRVSLFSFDGGHEPQRFLHTLTQEGTPEETVVTQQVELIHADLTAGTSMAQARVLSENINRSFQGVKLVGSFDLTASQAQSLLSTPNPDDVSNLDVVRPYLDGDDITRRRKDRWVIDFASRTEAEAARYFAPFAYVVEHVKPTRVQNNRKSRRERYWQLGEVMPAMRRAVAPLSRFLVTSEVAKHRVFVWIEPGALPSGSLVVIATDQDVDSGILNSHIHGIWALAQGGDLGPTPRYTPSTCFETFPFPRPTDPQRAEIEKWAKYVIQLRDHLLAQDDKATLTGIYNMVVGLREKPNSAHPVSALVTAHAHLDHAVAAAYGWEWPLTEDEVLARLLTLNLERAAGES